MRILFSLLFSFLLVLPAHAADLYGNEVTETSSFDLLTPENAAGAPDSVYADYRDEDAYLMIDMGEGEEGLGDLTMHIKLFDYGATAKITFFDADLIELFEDSIVIPLYSNTATLSYDGETAYRYVRIESTESETWSLDAVEAASLTSTEEQTEPESTDEETDTTSELTTGSLIKLADRTTVYMIGADEKRHAFPNSTVYESWFYGENFSTVVEVDAEIMASYALGDNMTMRPGSLVKIQTDPKVYAVEPDATLRWITTEALAEDLYGEDWNQAIVDVADTFWLNYTVGNAIEAAVHPDGTVIVSAMTPWYIENGTKFEISEQDYALMRMNPLWVLTDQIDELGLYIDGGDFEMTDSVRFPY